MKGKILEIDGTGKSWPSEHGIMCVFSVRIQALNDLIFAGDANAKSETIEGLPYKVGDDVEFEHTESTSNYPAKLKIKKEGSYSSGERSESKNRGFALRYATDLVIAGKIPLEDIYIVADKNTAWLDS